MENERTNLSQRTADRLREMISSGEEYSAGERLPNEIELSDKLDVSRTTLREAIRILVSEGILKVYRGKGTFVANEYEHLSESPLRINGLSDMKVTLRDLYETRMVFEPEAAALACVRASDNEIKEILRLGKECQKQILEDAAGEKRIESELAFHGSIIKASHNAIFNRFLPLINETIEKTFEFNCNLEMVAEDAYKDHIMIMNFLEKRDAQALKSAVTIHLHHAFWNEELDWQK